MGNKNSDNSGLDEKMGEMNKIFEELILDARGFAEDFIAGIYLNFVMGAVSIIMGVQTIWYNRFFIMDGDYIPLILAVIVIVSGILIILRGFTLRLKYSRFFEARKRLE